VGSEGLSVGKVGECDVANCHLQVYSPCLCQLSTDGLAPASKYWTYWSHGSDIDPVSLVTYHQQMLGSNALLQWLCWERNLGGFRGPLSRAERWSREHFFLKAAHLSNPVDDSRNVAIHGPHEIHTVEGHTQTKRGMCVACWLGFPCRVYIDSIHRDSWIWVTACSWQSSHS
jgi:hypothetical protein